MTVVALLAATSTVADAPVAPAAVPVWTGLIDVSDAQAAALPHSGVNRAVIVTPWSRAEPRRGAFDAHTLGSLRSRIATLRAHGIKTVLDPGLQYPPAWVFDLPGETRFVDQYGDRWHGTAGTDVANAVFNPAVRTAMSQYLVSLGAAVAGVGVVDVRVGGLLSGELRYPDDRLGPHRDALWMYDSAAQAAAPRPGWRPGHGATVDAQVAIGWYLNSLTGYLRWLMQATNRAMPGIEQQILFPSWGLRPGMLADALRHGLDGTTVAEVNGMLSAGLDWDDQVAAVQRTGIRAVVYTTWLDAPSQGSSIRQIPPSDYLALLARRYDLPIAGENTGGGGMPALRLSLSRACRLGFQGVAYMGGKVIDEGAAGLTLPDLLARTRQWCSRPGS